MTIRLLRRCSTQQYPSEKGDLNHFTVQCCFDSLVSDVHWTMQWLRSPFLRDTNGFLVLVRKFKYTSINNFFRMNVNNFYALTYL